MRGGRSTAPSRATLTACAFPAPSAAPSPRHGFSSTRIGHLNGGFALLVHGGLCKGECNNVQKDYYFSDTYLLLLHREPSAPEGELQCHWQKLRTTGEVPTARTCATIDYVRSDSGAWLFGGGMYWTDGTVERDLYRLETSGLSGRQWEWRNVTKDAVGPSPSARQGHASCALPDGYSILYHGGYDGITNFGDLHLLRVAPVPTWTSGAAPSRRRRGASTRCTASERSASSSSAAHSGTT